MAMNQRAKIGLKDVVFAELNEATDIAGGTPTYGTIYPLTNSMTLGYDPSSSIASLFADDGQAASAETVGEQKITLENMDILPANLARLLGHTYANGQVVFNSLDQSPYVAVGFKSLRNGKEGGAAVYDYTWLYKCRFMKPKLDAKSKGATVEFKVPMLEGLVSQLTSSGNYRMQMRTDDPNAVAATLTGFFTSVTLPGASLTAVTVGTITGSSSGKTITIPFAKGGETFLMADGDNSQITVSIVSTGALLAGTNVFTKSVAGAAPTIIITNSGLTAVAHLVSVTSNVMDTNGVHVTPKSQLVTPA